MDANSVQPETRDYDVVVIGAGPAGENVAQYATQHSGLTAVLVEAELVGGECSYYACMPSKALLVPLEIANQADHMHGLEPERLSNEQLLKRRDHWVSHYRDAGQVSWAQGVGLDVVRGAGRLIGERLVQVDGAEPVVLRARQAVVIATGSEPVVPAVYQGIRAWGSRDATGVVEVPGHLAIIGGGVVACEAATWMRALGSQVTMLVRGGSLLPKQEPFARELIAEGLRRQGIEVITGANVSSCTRADPQDTGLGHIHGGPVTLHLADGSGPELVADELLVATGRRPQLGNLGLDAVGLSAQDITGGSTSEWLYAVGDASGGALLTHMGKYQARVIGERIAARAAGRTPDTVPESVPVPQVIFTEPQLAHTGLTEAQARAAGIDVAVTAVDYNTVAGASLLRDDLVGRANLVIDRARKVMVGATFVGPEVGELIHGATIAIVAATPIPLLRHAVPSYPTASELWLRLIEALPEEVLH